MPRSGCHADHIHAPEISSRESIGVGFAERVGVALQLLDSIGLIGREDAMAGVSSLVQRSRLVTISGPGGIGKTRLAEELADAAEHPDNGLAFVDLASLGRADLIPDAITRSAGLELGSQSDPLEALTASLRGRRLLVVLDSCEYFATECARVAAALLSECPNVKVLATSREPLGLDDESIYRLGPLEEAASMELFELCARRDRPGFSFSETDRPILGEICQRLGGLALAIELTAPYVHAMSLGQLRSRLDGHFRLSVGSGRVESVVSWSYERLSPDEQAVFRRCSVFTGSFTADAARSIAGDAIEALVRKSMLECVGDRYRMLEPIRQFSLERLRAAEEEAQTRRSLAVYYTDFGEAASRDFGFGTQEAWLSRLEPELEHFRASLEWAHDNDVLLATRLVASLVDFWEFANLAPEGLRRSETVLAVTPDPESRESLPTLLAIGRLSMISHVYWHSFEQYERAKALARRYDDERAYAEALRIGARARRILGIETQQCVLELRDALEVIRREGNPYRVARTLIDYGFELVDSGDREGGRAILREAEAATNALGWPHLSAHLEINLAELEFRSGEAASAAERGRRLVAALHPRSATAMYALAVTNLASYLAVLGHADEAYERVRDAIGSALARDLHFCVAWGIQTVALVLAKRKTPEIAARLLGYVDEYVDFTSSKREPTEMLVQKRLIAALKTQLGERRFEEECRAGRALTERQAIQLALGLPGIADVNVR
jgi:predicted ATPase